MKKPSIKTTRRLCQLFVIILFIAIPILNKNRYSLCYGNLLSFHLWIIPLADPLAVLQLALKNLYITFENFIGAFLPLLLAYLLGTVFCSWMCPFGIFSEMGLQLRRKFSSGRSKIFARGTKGFPIKVIIFAIGIFFFLLYSTTPVLNQLSLPAWYSRFFQYLFGQDYFSLSIIAVFAVVLVEVIVGKRIWCRFICPQSILIMLAKRLNGRRLMVHFDPEKCICKNETRDPCKAACTLALRPKIVGKVTDLECTNCGDCITACNEMGKALNFKFNTGAPASKQKDTL